MTITATVCTVPLDPDLLHHDEEPMTECHPCSDAICDAYQAGLTRSAGGNRG